jgi:hypothetical protein
MVLALVVILPAAACADSSTSPIPPDGPNQQVTRASATGCADVVDVGLNREDSGSYRFEVTVLSADTGEEKYADRWEVRAPDGTVLGARVLTHPHVDEQPFTRSQSGISIPDEVSTVTVVARDSVEGFCGEALEVEVP